MDHPLSERVENLRKLKEEALQPGSDRSVERQKSRGKMLARQRIDHLLDDGSFHELDMLARSRTPSTDERPYTDGVITGWGTVDGRKVFVFSQDFTVFGGALGEVFAEKIHKLMDMAIKVGAPVIGINDGAGARIQEGVVSLASYGGIFYRNVKASGVTPQISVIMGPCAGGAVYSPIMTDFIFMVDQTSYMFITGPDVVKQVTGEEVTQQELGGAHVHTSKSGVAQFVSADDASCLDDVRYLLSFLPANNLEEPPTLETDDPSDRLCPELNNILPASSNQAYDIRSVVGAVVDDADFFEYAPNWAGSIVCGFARLGGQSVGIVGNQPMVMAGVLDIQSSSKAAKFVRTCDAFNIPLVLAVLRDVGVVEGGTDAAAAALIPVSAVLGGKVDLAFDHLRIVRDAIERVRAELELTGIATAFVGPTFTMAELRAVYEAVWGVRLDAANFRRSIVAEDGWVIPTGRRAQPGSSGGRPAELYRAGRAWKAGSPIHRSAPERKDVNR